MDQASVLIGSMPVGPKCASRAGLIPLAKRKGGLVFPVVRRQVDKPKKMENLDLFEVAA